MVVGRLLSYWEGICSGAMLNFGGVYLGCGPLTVTVTTRIITFLVGDPYKPSFITVTVRGPYPRYIPVSYRIKIKSIAQGGSAHLNLADSPKKLSIPQARLHSLEGSSNKEIILFLTNMIESELIILKLYIYIIIPLKFFVFFQQKTHHHQ